MFAPCSPAEIECLVALFDASGSAGIRASLQLNLLLGATRGPGTGLIASRSRWRSVLGAAGPREAVIPMLRELQRSSDALAWDEGVVPLPEADLQALGLRRVLRETFLQDLSKVPIEVRPRHEGVDYSRCEGALLAPARAVFAATHANTLEGFYMTIPGEPTLQACERHFDRTFSGPALIPDAALVAHEGDSVLGLLCCARDEAGEACVISLAVDPAARGRRLSLGLWRRCQGALRDAGYTRVKFLTTDRNLPVHTLFTAEELLETEVFPIWFGMRNRQTGLWGS